jgi:hypothetical protein
MFTLICIYLVSPDVRFSRISSFSPGAGKCRHQIIALQYRRPGLVGHRPNYNFLIAISSTERTERPAREWNERIGRNLVIAGLSP